MTHDRRTFLQWTAMVTSSFLTPAIASARRPPARIKAIAFDAFPIFDPRSIAKLAAELFPSKSAELMSLWRTRQFEYTWLRSLSGQYRDFWHVTEDALVYAAAASGVAIDAGKRKRLMDAFLSLKAWPDVAPVLEVLRAAGVRMAFLSNFTAAMLDAAVASAGLTGFFEPHLSVDRVRAYKPDPRAYQMGIDAFRVRREEIVFAAFASWDAAGAKWFGYPTIWVNRLGAPADELGVAADATGSDLSILLDLVKR